MKRDYSGSPRSRTLGRAVARAVLAVTIALTGACERREQVSASYTLTIVPAGAGSVDGCEDSCTESRGWEAEDSRSGFVVRITATAKPDFGFDRWDGGLNCPGPTCSFALLPFTNVNITAKFKATTPPTIATQPADLTIADGGSARFEVAATGPALRYQWQSSSDQVTWVPIGGATGPGYTRTNVTTSLDQTSYRVEVSNDAGAAVSNPARLTVLAEVCPTPPRNIAFDVSAPTPPSPLPQAALGVNLLVDGGFAGSVRVGLLPNGFGYWRFDEAVTVAGQQGIVPRSGPTMLHLVGSDRIGLASGTASEQLQLIEVSALATQIDANQLEVTARAWFNRITGCSFTDDAFGVHISAYDGLPTTFPTRHTNGVNQAIAQGTSRDNATVTNAWLRYKSAATNHLTPGTWLPVTATMPVPPGTRFLAIVVFANENKQNDPAFPEFHGHYADDAEVVLTVKQP